MHSHPVSAYNVATTSTHYTQQAMEAKRAALAVRKKLSGYAATEDAISLDTDLTDAHSHNQQKRSQPEPEEFRSVFFSQTV
jgi:hypothetical protein